MPLALKLGFHGVLLTFIVWPHTVAAPLQSAKPESRAAPPDQTKADVLLRDAQNAFAQRDYAAAIRNYQQLVALRPDSAEALSNLGVAYHFAGWPRDAVATLQKALKINPGMVPSNLLLGIDLVRLGRSHEALLPLETALKKDPANRDGLFALASAHFALQEFDEAARAYQRAVAVRPADSDAWYGMGLCFEHVAERTTRQLAESPGASAYYQRLMGEYLVEQGAGIDAEEAFRRALAATPPEEREGLYAGLGFAQLRLGEISGASEQFEKELRLHPTSLRGKLGTAAVAREQKDWGKAAQGLCAVAATDMGFFRIHLNDFLSALRESTSAEALSNLGSVSRPADCSAAMDLVLKEMTFPASVAVPEHAFTALTAKSGAPGAPTREVEAARRASEGGQYSECSRLLDPYHLGDAREALLAAQCDTLSGRFFAAFEAAQEITKTEPRNSRALYWQAESARKLAQAAFERAVNLNPNSWQGHVLLGDLFRQRKKWDVAISHYQEAVRLKPESPGPLLGLATIYWQTGRNSQGEEALTKALTMDPDNHMANFVLGDIYIRERRFEDAIPYLQKHLSRPPGFLEAHGDLGKAYAALGRDQEAIAELLIASPTDRFGELHFQLHTLYKKQGRLELARQALGESERLRSLERETQRHRLERVSGASDTANPARP
jgi:tetratricopeptide (TPR) repeat protein